MVDYTTYIRERITELRMRRGVSEYQMSLALGQNRNYIQGITSGKALPSMGQFLNICEYFEITPMQFFDGRGLYYILIIQASGQNFKTFRKVACRALLDKGLSR